MAVDSMQGVRAVGSMLEVLVVGSMQGVLAVDSMQGVLVVGSMLGVQEVDSMLGVPDQLLDHLQQECGVIPAHHQDQDLALGARASTRAVGQQGDSTKGQGQGQASLTSS